MRSSVLDVLPPKVARSLARFGAELSVARRKRGLTSAMMAQRVGVSKSTYLRVEKGEPTVALGAYAMALFVLGFGEGLADLIDPRRDDQGLLLDAQRLPTRVRPKNAPTPL